MAEINNPNDAKPVMKRLDNLEKMVNQKKPRKLRLGRAKTNRSKLKKGWIGVLYVNENRVISGEKVQIEDSAYRTKDGTYHALDGHEVLFWNGKMPVVIQPAIKINPIDLVTGKNETRGQKLVQAKLIKDTIKVKKGGNMSFILIIIVVIALGYILGKYVFKLF